MNKNQIKTIRKKLKLSQAEFGNKLNYSRQHLSFVELGKRPVGTKLERAINNLIKEISQY